MYEDKVLVQRDLNLIAEDVKRGQTEGVAPDSKYAWYALWP